MRAVGDLSLKQRDVILYGPPPQKARIKIEYKSGKGKTHFYETAFNGVIDNLQRRYDETTSDYIRSKLEEFMSVRPCPICSGKRLRPEALAVTIEGVNIADVTDLPVSDSLVWVHWLQGEATRQEVKGLRFGVNGDGPASANTNGGGPDCSGRIAALRATIGHR